MSLLSGNEVLCFLCGFTLGQNPLKSLVVVVRGCLRHIYYLIYVECHTIRGFEGRFLNISKSL